MNENRLTGVGAPTRRTVGVVGQHYEDTNTGNIYECLVASEQSKLNLGIGGGYVWKLKYTGDDRNDHEAIFGVGGSGGSDMVEKVLYQTDNARLLAAQGFHKHYIDKPLSFVVGRTYKVILDDTTYDCVAFSAESPDGTITATVLGNLHLGMPEFADIGEPFMIVPEDASHYAVWSQNGFKIFKITTMEEKKNTTLQSYVFEKDTDDTYGPVRLVGGDVNIMYDIFSNDETIPSPGLFAYRYTDDDGGCTTLCGTKIIKQVDSGTGEVMRYRIYFVDTSLYVFIDPVERRIIVTPPAS